MSRVLAALCLILTTTGAFARDALQFDIPAQDLAVALEVFAKQADKEVLFDRYQVQGKQSVVVKGNLDPVDALQALLGAAGLQVRRVNERTFVVGSARTAESFRDNELVAVAQAQGGMAAGRNDRREAESGSAPVEASNTKGDKKGGEIEEIVVTAQKRTERLQDVPMSITALSAQDLDRRGIVDTVDIAMAVPGVAVQDRGGSSRSRYIFMRGLGNTFGGITMVGVYLDEQDITAFPYYALDIRGYDLEQLEVLRGPQGTLYGSGAMGGVLRYITKKVDLTRTSGDTYVTASSTQDGSLSEKIGGSLNLPIASEKFGLRVSGFYEDSDGWIDQPAVSKSNVNDAQTYSVRAKTLWTPTEALEVSAMAMVQRNDTGAANVGEDASGNFTQQFGRATTPSGSNDFETYNLTAKYAFGNVQIVSSTGYVSADTTINEAGYILPLFPAPTAPYQVLFLDDAISLTSFTQELRLSSMKTGFFNWSAGASYRDANLKESGRYLLGQTAAAAGLFAQGPGDGGTKAWAVFGESSLNLTERLNLGAGLRYFEDRQRNKITNQSGTFQQYSPRFFGTFAFTDDVKAYANIAKGFRSGGFNSAAAIALGASPTFDSDVIWSYELGAKGRLFSRRLSFDVAAFHSDYTDAQDTGAVFIGGNVRSVAGNLGDAVIDGVDWDLGLQVTSAFSIGTGGEYLIKDEYTQINAVRSTVAVGDSLKQIPKYHVGAWGAYELGRWLGSDSGYVRIDYNRQGKATYRNRNANGDSPYYFSVSDRIDMLNASIGWEKKAWEVSLFARNLLNDRGYIDGESLELLAARSRPRTYGVNLRVRFD